MDCEQDGSVILAEGIVTAIFLFGTILTVGAFIAWTVWSR